MTLTTVVEQWLFWFSLFVGLTEVPEHPSIALLVFFILLFVRFFRWVEGRAERIQRPILPITNTQTTQTDPEITRNFWGVVYTPPKAKPVLPAPKVAVVKAPPKAPAPLKAAAPVVPPPLAPPHYPAQNAFVFQQHQHYD